MEEVITVWLWMIFVTISEFNLIIMERGQTSLTTLRTKIIFDVLGLSKVMPGRLLITG